MSELAAERLKDALWALGSDSSMKSLRKSVWRMLWARSQFEDWLGIASDMKKLADPQNHFKVKNMPRVFPQTGDSGDLKTVLEEIKLIAKETQENDDSISANFIYSCADDELRRLAHRGASPETESVPHSSAKVIDPNYINYDGYVCANVEIRETDQRSAGPSQIVPASASCALAIWMSPTQPRGAWSENVLIETGIDEDVVIFSFEVDCATVSFPFGRKRVRFHRREASEPVPFAFDTPKKPGEHLIYVHAFQERRLIKSLSLVLKVGQAVPKSETCPPKAKPLPPKPYRAARRSTSK